MTRESEIVLAKELLANVRRELGINGLREPMFTRLCAEEIRLQDRIAALSCNTAKAA